MSNQHKVVLYVKESCKLFSITARKPDARLNEVNEQMIGLGFSVQEVATGLSKSEAEQIKKVERSRMERLSYTYIQRESL